MTYSMMEFLKLTILASSDVTPPGVGPALYTRSDATAFSCFSYRVVSTIFSASPTMGQTEEAASSIRLEGTLTCWGLPCTCLSPLLACSTPNPVLQSPSCLFKVRKWSDRSIFSYILLTRDHPTLPCLTGRPFHFCPTCLEKWLCRKKTGSGDNR